MWEPLGAPPTTQVGRPTGHKHAREVGCPTDFCIGGLVRSFAILLTRIVAEIHVVDAQRTDGRYLGDVLTRLCPAEMGRVASGFHGERAPTPQAAGVGAASGPAY